jgi:hypothetical protein
MEVSIDDIDLKKLRKLDFFRAKSNFSGGLFFVAKFDGKGRTQRWAVIHGEEKAPYQWVHIFTTEEMKILYTSEKGTDGKAVRAPEDTGYRFLVFCGKLRMKVHDGCPGCRRFWNEKGSEGQCTLCRRCYGCCGKENVPYSCGSIKSNQRARASKQRYSRRSS